MADTTNRGGNVRDKAQDTLSSARQTAQEAKSTAQEALSSAGHKAQDIASNVAQKAQDVASAAGERADTALTSVGQSMSSLAGTIRQNAPHEGTLGSAASAVADRLQSGGQYLQHHGLGEMTEELGTLVRHHPLPAICVAFGIGWFMGMASRR